MQTDFADFQVQNHGSIVLLEPISVQASEWLELHIGDDAQFWGNSVVVEPRYLQNIVAGIRDDGLTVGF